VFPSIDEFISELKDGFMPKLSENIAQRALVCGVDTMYGTEVCKALKLQNWEVVTVGGLGDGMPQAHEGLFDTVVINAATDRANTSFLELEDQEFFDRCVTGLSDLFITLQEVSKRLRSGGSMVVIGSRAYAGMWYGADRAAWSAALIGLCRSLAIEFKADQKRVNVICPELTDRPPSEQVVQSVASTAVFLASQGSVGINGEHFVVDNAASLQMKEARQR
jgi:hypothetical protein